MPTLVALGLGQVEAGATSLLAIVPTAAVGVLRQRGRGMLRPKDALVIGIASFAGDRGRHPARDPARRVAAAAAVRRAPPRGLRPARRAMPVARPPLPWWVVRRTLTVVLAGVVVVALAGIAGAATGDPPAPSASASGQAALVSVPGQPGGATPSVSAPPNGEGGGGFAYPADGSAVRVGSSTRDRHGAARRVLQRAGRGRHARRLAVRGRDHRRVDRGQGGRGSRPWRLHHRRLLCVDHGARRARTAGLGHRCDADPARRLGHARPPVERLCGREPQSGLGLGREHRRRHSECGCSPSTEVCRRARRS